MSEPSPQPDDVVVVEEIAKDFRPGFGLVKKRVLHGISFRVSRGEIFGFVGPNGAGKTTTLKVLMGLIGPSAGRARILGHEVSETEFRRHVGFLPENPYFYDYLTGREILRFYARLGGVREGALDERVATLLDWVHLAHAADTRLRTYSKGMLQRIGIAQALVHDPEVVFLDEPMSGLDPLGRKEIRDLILRLREEGKTVFMNTHILSDVEMVCDRVAIIVHGRIRYEGRIEDFLADGERRTDVVIAGLGPEPAQRLEEEFGATLQGLGGHLEARVPEKHVASVIRVALDWGADIVSVTPHRASLEQIFLEAVAAGSQDEDSSAPSPAPRAQGGGSR